MRAIAVSAGWDYESPAGDSSLMARIADPNNLRKAFQRVKRNKGAAGIDRMTVDELFPHLQEHGREMRQCLLHGEWRPSPVRRVQIPKPDGGQRQLGIPTALDRMGAEVLTFQLWVSTKPVSTSSDQSSSKIYLGWV